MPLKYLDEVKFPTINFSESKLEKEFLLNGCFVFGHVSKPLTLFIF